jgi:pimeloyl-ACP methyl ester carboxylesterase/DNA-binding CsgD family transcriptional regulator
MPHIGQAGDSRSFVWTTCSSAASTSASPPRAISFAWPAPASTLEEVEQEIRFCDVDGRRLAYATIGEGPLVVLPTWWISHLEADWEDEAFGSFFTELAQTQCVVRYDRIGAGLSDRELDRPPTLEGEVRALSTLIDHLGNARATLFAVACAGPIAVLFAHRRPERVRSVVFHNSYAARGDVPDEIAQSLAAIVRANWGVGSKVITSLIFPEADGAEVARLSRFQRRAASGEAAAAFLELEFATDVRSVVPEVRLPALVMHRLGEKTVPFDRGRELAALLPDARLVPLRGGGHFPWSGDSRDVVRTLAGFLHDGSVPAPGGNGTSPLTDRETEVLRLVARGLSNREIAGTLVVSEHTVHRHVSNILRKLAQSSRAAAAAQAARAGLI